MQNEKAGAPRDIVERTFAFALRIIRVCRSLERTHGTLRSLSLQLLRAGTSIGANVEEAQAGQSQADFVSKMSIALKEARETSYWLRLLRESDLADNSSIDDLLREAVEIANILGSIVSRAKKSSRS